MRAAAVAALFLFAACDPPAEPTGAATQRPQGAPVPPTIEHDFGVIPHGESRQHDFPLDLAQLGPGWVPLRVLLDCSCGRGDLRIVDAHGGERVLDGRPIPENALKAGEKVVARVVIDTITKEAADLEKTTSRGQVLLQRVDDHAGLQRVQWPLLLRFGIDAPVVMRPFTAFDFGRVPQSRSPEIVTALRGDANHKALRFTAAESSDRRIECSLEPSGEEVVLRVRCPAGGQLGNHRAIVAIATDLPGYTVHVDVTWKVVPDLEATPSPKISFRADLRRPQPDDEAIRQFVIVTDHDTRRPSEFRVLSVVDDAGRDAATTFAVSLQPVPGQPRQHRLQARYVGGLSDGFRGRIVLGKPGSDEPTLPIELVVFPRRDS